MTSHYLLIFSLCNTSKTTFPVFLSFFLEKNVQILILKVHYLAENGLADFNDFGWSRLAERTLNSFLMKSTCFGFAILFQDQNMSVSCN